MHPLDPTLNVSSVKSSGTYLSINAIVTWRSRGPRSTEVGAYGPGDPFEHDRILFVRSGLVRQSEVLVAARWQRIWARMYLTNVRGKSGGTICTGCPFSIEVELRVALTWVRRLLSRGIKEFE